MKRLLSALLASIMLAIATVTPASAIDFTCNRTTSGQAIIRFFDYYDKDTAIYTQCNLPDVQGVVLDHQVLTGYPNNQAKSIVIRASSQIQGDKTIIFKFYDNANFTNQLDFRLVNEGMETWWNLSAADSNRISSYTVSYWN